MQGQKDKTGFGIDIGQFGEYDEKSLCPLAAGIEILHMATWYMTIIDDERTFVVVYPPYRQNGEKTWRCLPGIFY